MPQNEYIERWTKQHGRRLDHAERQRKKQARSSHAASKDAQDLRGHRAKLHHETRRKEKIQMKKKIRAHDEKNVKAANKDDTDPAEKGEPLPQYLLDRKDAGSAKALSSAVKNKRKEATARFSVPLPKVKGISEEEMFKAIGTGKKTSKKSWKRMITKPTFGEFVLLFSGSEVLRWLPQCWVHCENFLNSA